MTGPLLPTTISTRLAAKISGRSPTAVRAAIADGLLERRLHTTDVLTASLARWMGRDITEREYLYGSRQLDPEREFDRNRKQSNLDQKDRE
jgi:hypothetical protein